MDMRRHPRSLVNSVAINYLKTSNLPQTNSMSNLSPMDPFRKRDSPQALSKVSYKIEYGWMDD